MWISQLGETLPATVLGLSEPSETLPMGKKCALRSTMSIQQRALIPISGVA